MHDYEDSLRKIHFNIKFLKRSKNISNEKYSSIYRFYNNILEINIKRIIKT